MKKEKLYFRKKNVIKKSLISSTLALVLAVANVIPALAVNYQPTAPTSSVSTEGKTIKVSSAGAMGVIVEMLGGNLVAGSEVHLARTSMPYFMPVFGTSKNSNQDPWLTNAFYNTGATTKVSNSTKAAWVGSGPGTIDYTPINSGDSLSIPILVNKPDLIVVGAADKATLQTKYSYYSNDDSRYLSSNSLSTPDDIKDMVTSIASGMSNVMKTTGTTSRYTDPVQIAKNFNSWFDNNISTTEELVSGSSIKKVISVSGTSGSDWKVLIPGSDIFNTYLKIANGTNAAQEDGVMTTSEIAAAADVIVTTNPDLSETLKNIGRPVYTIPKGVYLWSVRSSEGALMAPWLAKKLHAGYDRDGAGTTYKSVDNGINMHNLTTEYYKTYYHYNGNDISDIVDTILAAPTSAGVETNEDDEKYTGDEDSNVGVSYQVHGQSYGWQNAVADGALAGTEGKSLRLEGIKLNLTGSLPEGAAINYETHVQGIGWQNSVSNGGFAGTSGQAKRMEAIKISLKNMPGYSVQYRAHVQSVGWQPWVNDGQIAGTEGKSLRVEALEIKIVKNSDTKIGVNYQVHGQNYGWQDAVDNGALAGTEGQGKRLEAIKLNLTGNLPEGAAISYETHVQGIGWQNAVTNGSLAGTYGQAKRMEAIKISLKNMPGYSVQYRAHVQSVGWQPWKSDGQIAGTEGKGLRMEALQIRIVKTSN